MSDMTLLPTGGGFGGEAGAAGLGGAVGGLIGSWFGNGFNGRCGVMLLIHQWHSHTRK